MQHYNDLLDGIRNHDRQAVSLAYFKITENLDELINSTEMLDTFLNVEFGKEKEDVQQMARSTMSIVLFNHLFKSKEFSASESRIYWEMLLSMLTMLQEYGHCFAEGIVWKIVTSAIDFVTKLHNKITTVNPLQFTFTHDHHGEFQKISLQSLIVVLKDLLNSAEDFPFKLSFTVSLSYCYLITENYVECHDVLSDVISTNDLWTRHNFEIISVASFAYIWTCIMEMKFIEGANVIVLFMKKLSLFCIDFRLHDFYWVGKMLHLAVFYSCWIDNCQFTDFLLGKLELLNKHKMVPRNVNPLMGEGSQLLSPKIHRLEDNTLLGIVSSMCQECIFSVIAKDDIVQLFDESSANHTMPTASKSALIEQLCADARLSLKAKQISKIVKMFKKITTSKLAVLMQCSVDDIIHYTATANDPDRQREGHILFGFKITSNDIIIYQEPVSIQQLFVPGTSLLLNMLK
ncbi:hypothetical protein P9112_006521 [Eukaryota sp. TZLM1-RC]